MRDGTPTRQVKAFPGGAGIAGILFAVASILIFLVDIPALRHYLPFVRLLVVALWALRLFRAGN